MLLRNTIPHSIMGNLIGHLLLFLLLLPLYSLIRILSIGYYAKQQRIKGVQFTEIISNMQFPLNYLFSNDFAPMFLMQKTQPEIIEYLLETTIEKLKWERIVWAILPVILIGAYIIGLIKQPPELEVRILNLTFALLHVFILRFALRFGRNLTS